MPYYNQTARAEDILTILNDDEKYDEVVNQNFSRGLYWIMEFKLWNSLILMIF